MSEDYKKDWDTLYEEHQRMKNALKMIVIQKNMRIGPNKTTFGRMRRITSELESVNDLIKEED